MPSSARKRTEAAPSTTTSAARPARLMARDDERTVLDLQHAAGNRAMQHLLRGDLPRLLPPLPRPHLRTEFPTGVQRFTEPGHKMIGDAAYGKQNMLTLGPGLKVTFGDALAMGDYFGSFEKMQALAGKEGRGPGTQGEVRYVLWVKIREKSVDEKMGVWYDKDAVRVRDQAERYLNSTNISHFPNPSAGDTKLDPLQKNQRIDQKMPYGAAATYRQGHEIAMRMAYAHGQKREAIEDALLADAFACHFLTDSFSASHIRVPRASIKDYWDKMVPGFHQKLIRWLADRVESGYGFGSGPAGTKPRGTSGQSVRTTGGQEVFLPGPGDSVGVGDVLSPVVNKSAVSSLAIALSPNDSLSFGNLVSLVVHDVEGAGTVEATVDGAPITLVGDKDLVTDDVDEVTGDHSHQVAGRATFDAATKAVKASIEDLYVAHQAGWDSATFSTATDKALGKDRLYMAERLVPVPLADSAVREDKRSMPWMFKSVGEFLADRGTLKGLVTWGRIEGPEFEKKLDGMALRGELPGTAKAALTRALVEPLKSGNESRIVGVIQGVIAHP